MTRTLDELLADAASRIGRYTAAEVHAAGVTLVDIRSQDSLERDGTIPGAYRDVIGGFAAWKAAGLPTVPLV